jgi:hypothetical protein
MLLIEPNIWSKNFLKISNVKTNNYLYPSFFDLDFNVGLYQASSPELSFSPCNMNLIPELHILNYM